ncbi:MAG: hypothetical protein M3O62_10605 [Pseudomonadota bacterium]|nr:hypothetical protein [Pseudomonadota bacterium]
MSRARVVARVLGFVAVLTGLPVLATATTPELLDRALALEAQVNAVQATPMIEDVAIYVSNPLADWTLIEVNLSLEGSPPRRYAYSPVEARALEAGGLHRLIAIASGTAPRHGVIEYFIRQRSAGRAVKPVRGRLAITLAPGTAQYVVQLQDRRLGEPELLWSNAADRVAAELRYADYLEASDHPARAAFLRSAFGEARTAATPPVSKQPQIEQLNAVLAATDPAALLPLAEADATGALGWALRDRANLRLGYLQLRAGAPAEAAEAFQRVRSPGPNSNAALLGFGWARLIPPSAPNAAAMYLANTSLRPGDADAIAAARRTTPFRYVHAVAHDNRAGDLRQALVPWGELIGRDPTDPAVQEGLLALAYAHGHLGAHAQADQYFRRAVSQLESLIDHYGDAKQDIADGGLERLWTQTGNADNGWPAWMSEMPEPRWWLTDPPNAPRSFYFEALINNPDFLHDLDQLLAVRELQELLHVQAQRLDGNALSSNTQLRAECDQLASRYKTALRARATQQLQAQRSVAEHYLAEASFALARMVDAPAAFEEGMVQ